MAVHNHGPNEGRGVDCHERLVGDCIYDTLTPAPAASGLDVVAELERQHWKYHAPLRGCEFERCGWRAATDYAARLLRGQRDGT